MERWYVRALNVGTRARRLSLKVRQGQGFTFHHPGGLGLGANLFMHMSNTSKFTQFTNIILQKYVVNSLYFKRGDTAQ
jgi:hypothetical protein